MSFVMHFDPSDDVLAAAMQCEMDVFLQAFGNTSDEWADEYGPYEASSTFIAIVEPGGDAVGCARLIRQGPAGLKTLNDASRPPWSIDGARSARAAGLDLDRTWDFATVSVRRGAARSGILSAALYRAVWLTTRANDVPWLVQILDAKVWELLKVLGFDFTALPGTRPGPYLGSESSAPVWMPMAAQADLVRVRNPEAHRVVVLGSGLDEVQMPTFEQFRLSGNFSASDAAASQVSQVPAVSA